MASLEPHKVSRLDDDADFAASFVLNRDEVEAALTTAGHEEPAALPTSPVERAAPNMAKLLPYAVGAAIAALLGMLLLSLI